MSSDVTVVVSTYRAARFIEGTLRSIFAQSSPPREIVVVDDHSADETCAIVERLSIESPVELRLIRRATNSGGPVAPMNQGIAAARGSLIAMLDHDDLMTKERIACALRSWNGADRVGLVFGRTTAIDENGDPIPRRDDAYARLPDHDHVFPAAVAFENLIKIGFKYGGAGGMMFTKAMWEELGGFSDAYKIAWDYDFALRATSAGWSIAYVPETVYSHRIHPGNLEHGEGGERLYEEVATALRAVRAEHASDSRITAWITSAIANKFVVAGQCFRKQRRYRLAAEYFARALRERPSTLRTWSGFCKIPIAACGDLFRQPVAASDR
ncbi:MAG: glycosyltransferase [Pirellulales bacterium]